MINNSPLLMNLLKTTCKTFFKDLLKILPARLSDYNWITTKVRESQIVIRSSLKRIFGCRESYDFPTNLTKKTGRSLTLTILKLSLWFPPKTPQLWRLGVSTHMADHLLSVCWTAQCWRLNSMLTWMKYKPILGRSSYESLQMRQSVLKIMPTFPREKPEVGRLE